MYEYLRATGLAKLVVAILRVLGLQEPIKRSLHGLLQASPEIDEKQKIVKFFNENFGQSEVEVNTILLDSFWGRIIGCNPYAIYRALVNDPCFMNCNYIWVRNVGTAVPEDVASNANVTFVEYESKQYIEALLKAKYLIGNTNFPPYFVKNEEQVYINPWHGTPVKKIGRDGDRRLAPSSNTQRNFFSSDIILSNSNYATDKTINAHEASLALPCVYEIGTPRIDLTLSTDRADVRQQLQIRLPKKVLLYAPTWRGSFGKQSDDVSFIREAIQNLETVYGAEFEIFVSLHNITASKMRGHDFKFREPPLDMPVNVLLAGVDLLITDYSSIMVDYLCLDRPIVLYCPDLIEFTEKQGLHLDLAEFPGSLCTTIDGLIGSVKKAKRPSAFSSYPSAKSLLIPLEDGMATSRALSIIKNRSAVAPTYKQSSKKRVLIYAGGMFPNGISNSMVSLSRLIDKTKYDIHIIVTGYVVDRDQEKIRTLNKLDPEISLVLRGGATAYLPDERSAYKRFRETGYFQSEEDRMVIMNCFKREKRRVLGMLQFDVVIDFSGYGPFWALFLLQVEAKKHIIFQHNDMHSEAYNPNPARSFPELPCVFSLYKEFDTIVSVTQAVMELNREKLSNDYYEGTALTFARNTFDVNLITEKSRLPISLISTKLGLLELRQDIFKFVCVARLSPEKNHERLFRAFAIVLETEKMAMLTIVGNGKLKKSLEALAKTLGIDEHVHFAGHVNNPYPIIKSSDCSILASDYEGQGIVLLEAMTLGTPCIATYNPAVAEVLRGDVGILTEPTSVSLADAMLDVMGGNTPNIKKFYAESYCENALAEFYSLL